jgi:hypothetical protein
MFLEISLTSPDIYRLIISLLGYGKHVARLHLTCKKIKKICEKSGYIRTLSLDDRSDTMQFLRLFTIHSRSIRSVIMNGVVDPGLWLPSFPRNIIIKGSSPPFILPGIHPILTHHFTFIDKSNKKIPLYINWKRFVCLKTIHIVCWSANTHDLNIQDLESVYLELDGVLQNSKKKFNRKRKRNDER